MQITEVRASWTETANLGNYSNVKPSLSLAATLEEGEDAARAYEDLMAECRIFVQEQVDLALEADDQPAKYSSAPRFDVHTRHYHGGKLVLIVPADAELSTRSYSSRSRLRLPHAQRYAVRYVAERGGESVRLIDCSDGDLAPALAALEQADQADAVEDKRKQQLREAQERAWHAQYEAQGREPEDEASDADEEE